MVKLLSLKMHAIGRAPMAQTAGVSGVIDRPTYRDRHDDKQQNTNRLTTMEAPNRCIIDPLSISGHGGLKRLMDSAND